VEHKVNIWVHHPPWAVRLAAILLIFLLLPDGTALQAQDASSQITVYLEKTASSADSILQFGTLTLQGPYASSPLRLVSPAVSLKDLSLRQVLLAESEIEPGEYTLLIVSLPDSSASREDTSSSPFRDVAIEITLSAKQGQCQAFFLQWLPSSGSFRLIHKTIPPMGSRMFVSNRQSGNVSVIDRVSQEVVGVIRVGEDPQGMAISTRRNLLFVANALSNSVTAIDLRSLLPQAVIPLDFGDEPQALALSSDGRELYTANRGSSSVTVIDALNLTHRNKISVGSAPADIAVDPVSGWVFTANSLSDDVSAFQTGSPTSVRSLPVGSKPVSLEVNSGARSLFVANYNSGTITQINLSSFSVSGTLNTSRTIIDLTADSRAFSLFCAIETLNRVSVLRPALNVDLVQIPVDPSPAKISLDPEEAYLYVTCSKSNTINQIDKNSGRLKTTIAAGLGPYAIVFP
jgi:YVTN family beta-propeller protein